MPRTRKPRLASKQYWIGYCRKSTDSEDKQIHSLQDQTTLIESYYAHLPPEDRQYPLRMLQEAQSAYRPGRPVFRTVLQLADAGEVHGLIVVHPNRVSRNHADSGAFVQRLVEGTVRSLDTTTGKRYTGRDSDDIFMLTLEGAMSWKDSRDKGDRIRDAMRLRAREGRVMGQARLGYRNVCLSDGKKSLEVVPEVAPQVHRLFQLSASWGYSILKLVEESRRMGLRSRNGNYLSPSAVHGILRDPVYKGYVRFDGIFARGSHDAIVEEEVWEKVQAALTGRQTFAGRPKDLALRELFVFGSLLRCPHCRRALVPYRAKGKYIYYECKNKQTKCRVLIPQADLVAQLRVLISGITLGEQEIKTLRSQLLSQHHRRSDEGIETRRELNAEYEQVVRSIGDLFAQRRDAAALGVLDQVDQRLGELARRRDELQKRLNAGNDEGSEWVESVVRSFRFIELLQEAIFFGSARPRELALRALASNYSVEGKKLLVDLRSPFRQSAKREGHSVWWSGQNDVRTEVRETADLLHSAYQLFVASRALAKG